MELNEAISHAREVAKEKRELTKTICPWSDDGEETRNACLECAEEHEQLAAWLEELEQRREADRWIPISERLPEEDDDVLITLEYGNQRCVIKGCYSPTFKVWLTVSKVIINDNNVIAWKPLPKPYESEDN